MSDRRCGALTESVACSMGTPPAVSERGVPARARELAGAISVLFTRDAAIVARLNDAQQRLRRTNDRLWSGLHPDALGVLYDGIAAGGSSVIAALDSDGRTDADTAMLTACQQAHWSIHRAFCDYQDASEERRKLAVEVGELSQQLTETLRGAGWSTQNARQADVHQLARAGA
jgi:hypothetical protein